MEQTKHLLLIISIFSLLLSFSAEAICVPKNTTRQAHSPARLPSIRSPPHVSSPPRRPVASHSTPFDPAIKAICEKTDYPFLCMSSLAPFLASSNNPAAVLEMAIKASVNYTEAALAKAMRLSSDPSTSSITKAYIADCQENYSDAIDNFNIAANAISSGDIGLMNSMLSGAISDFQTCDDGFAEMNELDSPFKEIDTNLSHMASNCLAIAALLP